MPVDFPAHLYSFVPGRGFGVAPHSTWDKTPAMCSTYEPIAEPHLSLAGFVGLTRRPDDTS